MLVIMETHRGDVMNVGHLISHILHLQVSAYTDFLDRNVNLLSSSQSPKLGVEKRNFD